MARPKIQEGSPEGALDTVAPDPALQALREQIRAAAAAFAPSVTAPGRDEEGAHNLSALLSAMVDDVGRAAAEPVEIFPVKHHSPSSALHMVARLRGGPPPRVIFLEGCDDFGQKMLEGLRHCRFPVALQAYAPEARAFPAEWTPLNLVAPLTEFSAEYQVIAYCLQHPETKLVFVDRSADHVFQWIPREGPPPGVAGEEDEEAAAAVDEEEGAGGEDGEEVTGNTANLHGGAVGLQIGAMQPTFDEFLAVLLRNARVRHYGEWWTQYVEGPTLGAGYATYRHVFFLVGSLLRRIGITAKDRAMDEQRERYMWARIRQHLREHRIDPKDAMYVCGAVHAVSPIPEFGTRSGPEWAIPPRTETTWCYGVVPSSYAAIEHQFGMPAGEIAIAQSMWDKGLAALSLRPFRIEPPPKEKDKDKDKEKKKPAPVQSRALTAGAAGAGGAIQPPATGGANLRDFLTQPPAFVEADDDQLIGWCTGIVRLARKNGYLATTADTIAIHHTAKMLARLRDRPHPSPYDFQDAAITCLEKDRTPRRRNVARLCQILLGGDRLGRVGYESLPPLAQDVYDRLQVLGVDLKSSRIERALLDIQNRPELLPASDLLWRLRFLGVAVRPIMGERSLGHKPRQESWDIEIGKHQGALIQLGYEGMTVEQVLEGRLKAKAYGKNARAAQALEAAEQSVLLLRSGRLTREIGMRATALLRDEVGAADAPEIFQRVRALVHYYRTVGMPEWIKDFVATGYQHYTTLLPGAFTDRGTAPKQLAAMLAFIFTQEALAFSMGCQRSQLVIAIEQANPEDPTKLALLWAAQWIVGLRDEASIRGEFLHLLQSPLLLPAFPSYMAGLLLSLDFTPRITRIAVELLSRAFGQLPDEVLVPWLPNLVVSLRPLGGGMMQTLIKEAGLAFPRGLSKLPAWEFPWERALPPVSVGPEGPQPSAVAPAPQAAPTAAAAQVLSPGEAALAALLRAHPQALDALAGRLGARGAWTDSQPGAQASPAAQAHAASATPAAAVTPVTPLGALLAEHPAALQALSALVRA